MYCSFDAAENRRGTGCIKWDTVEPHVLSVGIADMDFKTASEIISALEDTVRKGVFGYSLPNEDLIASILKWYEDTYHGRIKREWLVFLPGIVSALQVASALSDGTILTTVPNYALLLAAPEKAGKMLRLSPLKNVNGRYEMDFKELEERVVSSTDLFLLCNPHNPVGRVYTREELEQLAEFCGKHHLIMVSDEIHCELVFDHPHTPLIEVNDYAKKYGIMLMSPAKTYNLPGIPFGFAVIPNTALRNSFLKAGFGLSRPGTLGQVAAAAAYGRARPWKETLIDYLRDNRDYLEGEFKRRFPKAAVTHAEGTYLIWLDFREYGIKRPYEWFLEHAAVSFTNGKDFGDAGRVRMNFGTSRNVLTEVLDRMEQAISLWQANEDDMERRRFYGN